MGKVIAVCTSPAKGTQKTNIGKGVFLEDYGIEGDAHAGKWHRQVSLLSYEKIEDFRARGAVVEDGAFGENLVVKGNEVILELTQIGKECHHGCEIFQKMGECIMPREGVFTKVIHGGTIEVGDDLVILEE